MKNPMGKRLTKKKWDEIRLLLKNPDRNISEIAIRYNIGRATIYHYAWNKGWIKRKKKTKKENKIKRILKIWKG